MIYHAEVSLTNIRIKPSIWCFVVKYYFAMEACDDLFSMNENKLKYLYPRTKNKHISKETLNIQGINYLVWRTHRL